MGHARRRPRLPRAGGALSGRTVIFGAGPAGLAAAYTLARAGEAPLVIERSGVVGGISRTVEFDGYRFDLGGHRFFTRFPEVQALWEEVLGGDFLDRPRLSRILYDGRFFDYPLRPANALRTLGARESVACMASYARARVAPRGDEATFEGWVQNRFGTRLFDRFFRSYTEKVWGIPTAEIGAEWASQRIKNLDLGVAVAQALRLRRRDTDVTSLIERFQYPRTGPGLLYDRMAARVVADGGEVRFRAPLTRVEHAGGRVTRAWTGETPLDGAAFLSSMPLTHLVEAMDPPAPEAVRAAARALTFRHLLLVGVVVDRPELFPDTWIYVHDARLRVGRIQNFGNWSPYMVPDTTSSGIGMEYFCSDGDALWTADDETLSRLATTELAATGLLGAGRVVRTHVVRVPRAYPVYRRGYEAHLATLVGWLRTLTNLQPIGRYGMFKYNNADHSILTALLAVENLRGAGHDVWAVNTDSDYQEIRRAPAPARGGAS
jgi:protoporphyrinogen oxidase